jgi:ATP-dependent exoDNAse (exonuclease V) beta subunit
VYSRVQEEKSCNIEPEVKRFEKELFNEKNIDWVTAISRFDNIEFDRLRRQLQDIRRDYVGRFNQLGNKALDMIRSVSLSNDDFAYKKSGVSGFLQKCADLRVGKEKDFEMGVRFRNGQWTSNSTSPAISATIDNLRALGLDRISRDIILHYDTQRSLALTAVAVLDNIYLAAIIKQVKALIEDYKHEYNVVPISEFNIKVYEIVKNSPIPFIYSLLGEKFNHYLMDEFQDTSRLQWENLFPLIDNALGSGYFSMAVGDGKQSIYRWRGGDVAIMETDVNSRIIPELLTVNVLDKNFRSREQIVTFNNRFFEALRAYYRDANALLQGIYSDIAQTPDPKPGGFVSLQFLETTNPAEEADPQVFAAVKTIIGDCLARGWEYRDIAILVRENRKGQILAEKLLENHIPVVSPDSLLLEKVPLIRFLIAVLTYLANPADRINEAAIIYFLSLHKRETPLDPALIGDYFMEKKQWDISPEIAEFFKRRTYLIRMPVYEVVEEIIRIFKLDKPGESLDFITGGYLQAFLDVVSRYTAENSVDISSFLDWWEFNKEEFTVAIPENKPAVKIMTIHKAKGLEFPVVIIPYVEWEHRLDKQVWLAPDPLLPTDPPLKTPMPVNANKILEETFFQAGYREEKEKILIDNINLLYVAFTRAVDSLHIIAQQKENYENYLWLRELAVPAMKADENQAETERYTYGEPVSHGKKEAEKPAEIEFAETREFLSHKWYNKITIRRKSKEFWRFDAGYRSERRTWGILMHQVLANIGTEADVPAALHTALVSGDITSREKDILAQKLLDIFAIDTVKQWFNPRLRDNVFIEAPVLTDKGVLRPDRVIVDGDTVTIIDFKTGAKHESHNRQMILYRNAVRAMGYRHVDGYLFYLETKEIEKVWSLNGIFRKHSR